MKTTEIEKNEISQPGCANNFFIFLILIAYICSLIACVMLPYFAFFEGENSTSERTTICIISIIAFGINIFSIKALSIVNGGALPETKKYLKKQTTKPLVTWHYNYQEWVNFYQKQFKSIQTTAIIVLLVYLTIWIVIYIANEYHNAVLYFFTLITSYSSVVFYLFAKDNFIKKWKNILLASQRKIEIYKQGILINDEFMIPLTGHYVRLLDVEIALEKKSYYLTFTINTIAGEYPESNIHKRKILIPEGQLEAAKKIISRFTLYKR
ncbi:hypothetical protein [Tenacibaculum agarivorans]|uniref:hypothetical protein n=1 Tax=Tenacibaculum agarivorans TaxID=1908389 RepID=UPI00094B92E8|nr:hypothetical protein [Tenacibaculum agarivorans]